MLEVTIYRVCEIRNHRNLTFIQQIAKLAGTTSRTLRHYDDTGLVPPSRIGDNGYRHHDSDALVRLQRLLLLRELGLGIPAIAATLERQIASVESTIDSLEGGEKPMAEDMVDGFDHTQYQDEVEERWGKDEYAKSDAWWRGMSTADKSAFLERTARLGADWLDAAARGIDPSGGEAQALTQRQFDWLAGIPGATFVRDAMTAYADRNL